MDNGDLSTDLTGSVLEPTSSVRPPREQVPNQDTGAKDQRRRPTQPESEDESTPSENPEGPPHQVDRMA